MYIQVRLCNNDIKEKQIYLESSRIHSAEWNPLIMNTDNMVKVYF